MLESKHRKGGAEMKHKEREREKESENKGLKERERKRGREREACRKVGVFGLQTMKKESNLLFLRK